MSLPPWVKEIGAAIGLVLSSVALVRLAVSGRSAFVDVLTWSGAAAAVIFTLLALLVAIRPNEDLTRKQRIFHAAVAIVAPIVTVSLVAHGERDLLRSFGATLYLITAILLYVIYDERKRARANSVKECPDCIETSRRRPASAATAATGGRRSSSSNRPPPERHVTARAPDAEGARRLLQEAAAEHAWTHGGQAEHYGSVVGARVPRGPALMLP